MSAFLGRNITSTRLFWLVMALVSLVLAMNAKGWSKAMDVKWAMKYPRSAIIPLKTEISNGMTWLIEDATFGVFTFKEFTRAIAWVLELPLTWATSLLSSGFVQGQGSDAIQLLPPVSWVAVIAVIFTMGYYARSWSLGLFVACCFIYLAIFGQWESAMITLSSIVIAVPFSVVGGLLVGTAGYRWKWIEKVISPILDLMQTVPIFVYSANSVFVWFRSSCGNDRYDYVCNATNGENYNFSTTWCAI